jgi:hypothetical protein
MDEKDLTREAVTALRSAAERLGVDAYRLARFLADGKLSDILDMLGRPSSRDQSRRLELAEEYLDFLDREIAIQDGRRPTNGHSKKGG